MEDSWMCTGLRDTRQGPRALPHAAPTRLGARHVEDRIDSVHDRVIELANSRVAEVAMTHQIEGRVLALEVAASQEIQRLDERIWKHLEHFQQQLDRQLDRELSQQIVPVAEGETQAAHAAALARVEAVLATSGLEGRIMQLEDSHNMLGASAALSEQVDRLNAFGARLAGMEAKLDGIPAQGNSCQPGREVSLQPHWPNEKQQRALERLLAKVEESDARVANENLDSLPELLKGQIMDSLPETPEQTATEDELTGIDDSDVQLYEVTEVTKEVALRPSAELSFEPKMCEHTTAEQSRHTTAEQSFDIPMCKHTLHEGIWEAAFLAFTPAMSAGTSLGVVLVLALNVCVQVVFCAVVFEGLAATDSLPSLRSVTKWRETVAHSDTMMDRVTWTSLADLVCYGDMLSSPTSGFIQAIDAYNSSLDSVGLPQGPLLAALCLLLWLLSVVPKVRLTVDILFALLHVPMGDTMIVGASGGLTYQSMTGRRRSAMLLVTLVRASISVVLTMAGASWLVRTMSTADILLNTAALTVVLRADEIFFAAFVSDTVRTLLSKFEPSPRRAWSHGRGADWWPPIVFGAALLVVGSLLLTTMSSHAANLSDIRRELCGGLTSFVAARNPSTGVIYSAHTNPFVEVGDRNSFEMAIHERIWREDVADPLSVLSSQAEFLPTVSADMESFHTGTCRDATLNDPALLPGAFFAALADETGVQVERSSASCEAFADRCGDIGQRVVRWLCPLTCGCADALSGLFDKSPSGGCPAGCASLPLDRALADAPCADRGDVASIPGWRKYWESYRAYWRDSESSWPAVEGFLERAASEGCGALADDPFAGDARGVCSSSGFSSLSAFCPTTCGCNAIRSPGCPATCTQASER